MDLETEISNYFEEKYNKKHNKDIQHLNLNIRKHLCIDIHKHCLELSKGPKKIAVSYLVSRLLIRELIEKNKKL